MRACATRRGSFKARLCRAGKTAMEAYAVQHDIPVEHVGKLVVALGADELPRMRTLLERGLAERGGGPREVGPERMREIEPHVAGVGALWSPRTAIIDFVTVSERMAGDIRAMGGEIQLGVEVTGIRDTGRERVVATIGRGHRDPQRDRVRRAPVGPPADDRAARRRADHPVSRRLLLAPAGGPPPRPRPDLSGPGPGSRSSGST